MGGKCCTDRKEPANRDKDGKPVSVANAALGSKSDRKPSQAGAYDAGKKRALSIGYHSTDDDAYKFDKAFESNDLQAFVKLLSSNQPIESFEERMHPWAEDPKTVGALAGTQLAILASVAEKENPSVKVEIREAGGIPPLVEFLKSEHQDRVQTAVVALSFLTADCPENTIAIYEAGAMPELMKHLDSPVAGMRAAAATTLRNICMEGDKYRDEFVTLGGLKGLVNQLASAPDPALNYADVQLEAVLNIQDLIENDDGSLIEAYAKEAVKLGVREKLSVLMESEDEEVRSSAEEVMQALEALDP
mmetsp:Transcript_77084/g.160450  ORF Transcript_77084/g.160450 Transcript_77084/m.160450 type:complete len:304 (-) Transcript_77084:163-1074(-)